MSQDSVPKKSPVSSSLFTRRERSLFPLLDRPIELDTRIDSGGVSMGCILTNYLYHLVPVDSIRTPNPGPLTNVTVSLINNRYLIVLPPVTGPLLHSTNSASSPTSPPMLSHPIDPKSQLSSNPSPSPGVTPSSAPVPGPESVATSHNSPRNEKGLNW
jgi:hypothetical protein